MSNFYVGEVLFETGGTIETPGDITVTAICDCTGSLGTSGQLLSSTGTALEWITAGSAGIPCSILTAKGDMIVASAAGTPAALPVGANGRFLVACSTCTDGVGWAVLTRATPTVFGVVNGQTNDNVTLNTALGRDALNTTLTGCNNVAVGYFTLASVTSGSCNTVVGMGSATSVDTGSENTVVGVYSLSTATGSCNSFVGSVVGQSTTTASCNSALGRGSLDFLTSGCANVALGFCSGYNITTGSQNVALGPNVQVASATGSCQLAIGFSPTGNWLTGTSTKAIKPGAGIIDCAGSCGTNGQVLMSNGSNAICWGTAAGASAATPTARGIVYGCTTDAHPTSGTGEVALGLNAYCSVTTGYSNTAIGGDALGLLTSGCNNVGIGDQAGFALTAECNNVVIGANTVINGSESNSVVLGADISGNFAGTENVIAGFSSLNPGTSGTAVSCSVILGGCALTFSNQVGDNLIAIGHKIVLPNSNGSTQLAIGNFTSYWLSGDSNYAIKPGAGIIDCAGSCGTAGQVLCSNGSNAIQWATPQTSPFITYTTSAVSYTNGTPLLVAIWGGGTIQGTINLDLVGYGGFQNYWNIFLSGDPTNYNTGWNQTDFYPPTSNPVSQGTWSVDFPVYPDPNANQWMIYFNPTQDALNPSPFTFFYRLLSGSNPNWQI